VDNPDARRPELRFAPDSRYTALAGAGVVAALVAVLLTADLAGRVLAGTAAVVLAGYLAADLLFRPQLRVDAEQIVINSPLVRARLPWPAVEDVRADTRERFGLRSTTLEIDAGATLAVFSRRAIGADPADAAELIRAFRPG
jgi:hypothetical protein